MDTPAGAVPLADAPPRQAIHVAASGDLTEPLGHENLIVKSVYLSEVDEHKRSAVWEAEVRGSVGADR
jgi:hypothetical protein